MRWLTNICNAVHFTPWNDAQNLVEDTANQLKSIPQETRNFLNLYLNPSISLDHSRFSDEEDTLSSGNLTAKDAPILQSLEVALTLLESAHRYHLVRSSSVCSEVGYQYRPQSGGIRRALTVNHDFAVYPGLHTQLSDGYKATHALPITSIKHAQGTTLFPENTKINSPRAMAACYNDIFSDEQYADPTIRHFDRIRAIMKLVAGAVTQALCTQTGCCALTNGYQAVLFCVNKSLHQQQQKVQVMVSRVFQVDMPDAIVGMVRHAMHMWGACDHIAATIRDCALAVGNVQTRYSFDSLNAFRVQGMYSTSSKDDSIDHMLAMHQGVIGVGSSGVVLKSQWQGQLVAVKWWNEVDMEGVTELLDEMRMYELMRKKGDDLIGRAVPNVLFLRNERMADAVLVTEFVGRGLRRGKDAHLLIGDGVEWQRVHKQDEQGVVEAARKSLNMIHQAGIAHGDVALENLRVDLNNSGEDGRKEWNAWWIDFGRAEIIDEDDVGCIEMDLMRFEDELEMPL